MHEQLERAVAEAVKLPEEEQAALGAWLMEELANERRWAESLVKSPDALKTLAEEARAERRAGRRGGTKTTKKTTRQILEEAGQVRPLGDALRALIVRRDIPLEEVRSRLGAIGGPTLSEIIDEHRGPKL